MSQLTWTPMRADLPQVQMWGAKDGFVSFIITRDLGCRPDDPFYGRYAVSARLANSPRTDLGLHDTLDAAKAAAEATLSL